MILFTNLFREEDSLSHEAKGIKLSISPSSSTHWEIFTSRQEQKPGLFSQAARVASAGFRIASSCLTARCRSEYTVERSSEVRAILLFC
jgi:hypothetical protein